MNIQDKGSLEGILQKTRPKKLIWSILYINSKGGQICPPPERIKTKNSPKGIGLIGLLMHDLICLKSQK